MPTSQLAIPASRLKFKTTTIYLMRHADTNPGTDQLNNAGQTRAQELIRVLEHANLAEIYASEFQRTQQTVAPLAQHFAKTPHIFNADDVSGLVQHIRSHHADEQVLVAGHSDTVPLLIAAFGGEQIPDLQPREFDKLFVVTITKLSRATVTVQSSPSSIRIAIPERSTTRVLQMQYGAVIP